MALDPLLQPILEGFLRESREISERLTALLLPLEAKTLAPGEAGEARREIARGLHTLKGSAATLGLVEHAELVHAMEGRYAPIAAGAVLERATVDALLGALDTFLQGVQASVNGESATAVLTQRLAHLGGAAQAPSSPAAPEASRPLEINWRIDEAQVNECLAGIEQLRELRLRLGERRLGLERISEALSRLLPGAASAALRGELSALGATLDGDGEEAAGVVGALEGTFRAICTVSVRASLEPLQRMVRDLCHELGKEAQLSLVGGELALDRRIIEGLRGPLVHLLRNAVDHGLETPQVREQAGKHRQGALVIRLDRVGSMLFVEVSDDGGGVDLEAVRARAVERGLLTADTAAQASAARLAELLFLPGFSSRRDVTQVSGRGVGLDVVKGDVERLGGRVELTSTPGQGTRFTLSVPSELGTSPLLVVRAGEQTLAVPILAIEATLLSREETLHRRGDRVLIEHREALIPVQDLAARLGLRAARAVGDRAPLLVLQHGGAHLALRVDEVLGDRELNQRPLPRELQTLDAYQGAAVMADGELVLTLRPEWLVQGATEGGGSRGIGPATAEKRALVVDDSLTARALHRTMLEAGGYEVHTAQDGRAGLELARRGRYDVVVCDIGMEPMDGFALTQALRQTPAGRELAVVLVSAHDDAEDLARGLEAGADAHLAKRECAAGRLLDEITRVLARRRASA